MALNQERARLKARSMNSGGAYETEAAAIEASIANKKLAIEQINEKIKELDEQVKLVLIYYFYLTISYLGKFKNKFSLVLYSD